jgi:hypothetical protein
MAASGNTTAAAPQDGKQAGGALDIPEERRALAKAHAALLAETAARIAVELPMSADVDDFRRVLAAEAKP